MSRVSLYIGSWCWYCRAASRRQCHPCQRHASTESLHKQIVLPDKRQYQAHTAIWRQSDRCLCKRANSFKFVFCSRNIFQLSGAHIRPSVSTPNLQKGYAHILLSVRKSSNYTRFIKLERQIQNSTVSVHHEAECLSSSFDCLHDVQEVSVQRMAAAELRLLCILGTQFFSNGVQQ